MAAELEIKSIIKSMIKSMIKTLPAHAACTLGFLLAGLPFTHAEDWPRWGGNDPGRNMYSPATGLPEKFGPVKPDKLGHFTFSFRPNTEDIDLGGAANVKWIAKLGSQTYGNPVVANGKVFVGTNNASPRDPKYKDDRSCLYALNAYNGDFLWQLAVPKLASGKVNDWEYLGILASPCVDGSKVYLVTNRCEVVCLDAEGMSNGNDGPFKDEAKYLGGPGKPPIEPGPTDADILWRYDMMDELGVFPHNASNCSVITLGDKLFTCTSNGQDWTHVNIPSPQSPSFIVLDKNTGEFLAEDDAKIGPNIKHGQWTSPSLGKVAGKDQVYFGGGDGILYAFGTEPVKEGDSTYMKKVWWFDPSNTPPPKAPARSTPRPSSTKTASMSPSARIPSTAKASAASSASMPPRPATSRKPASSGISRKSTVPSPPSASIPQTACSSSATSAASSTASMPRQARSTGNTT